MICPNCSTSIPDGALRCPACHADLAVTTRMPRLEGRWCPSCGSLVPDDRETCPSCGMLVPFPEGRRPRKEAARPEWMLRARHVDQSQGLGADTAEEDEPQDGTRPDDGGAEDAPDLGTEAAAEEQATEEPEDPELAAEADDAELEGFDDEDGEPEPFVPHFDSAIPMGDRFGIDARQERMPRTASFLVAAIASLVVIGGSALIITHPYDAASFETRAVDEKDTSQVGYPGEVQVLSGQDSGGGRLALEKERDQNAFTELYNAYVRVGELRADLEENENLLLSALANDDATLIAGGYGVAESGVIETGRVRDTLTSASISSSSYADQAAQVAELADWLRSWSEALVSSWEAMDESYYPSYAEEEVMGYLYGGEWHGVNAGRVSFDENYVSRFPVEIRTDDEGDEASSADAAQADSSAATGADASSADAESASSEA